jgi:soluble lytic murein transglycosylase-like protein
VEVVRVMRAMEILAATENTTTDKLMLDPERVAEAFVTHASEHNLDPLLLVAIAWSESRFRADAKGDHLGGAPRSCGMTQVRTDFKGRPTCEALLDPDFAISWTAQYLVDTSQKGKLQLNRYNGGDYEVRIWRKVDWLKRELTALPS